MRSALVLCIVAGVLPAQNTATFPAWSTSREGSTYDANLPFANGVSRIMMIYDKAELTIPAHSTINKLAYRQDSQTKSASTGYNVQLETLMCESAKDFSSATATFANNYLGAPVTVFAKKIFSMPSLPSPTTAGPSTTFLSLPLDTPFQYTKVNNLLVEHKVYANTNGNASFSYYIDVDPFNTTSSAFGAGCVNSSNKTASIASNTIGLGGYWQLSVTSTTPVAPTAIFIGAGNAAWNSIPLPLDLGMFGAPGCKVLTDMLMNLGGNSTSSGTYNTGFYTPADPKLNGAKLYAQAVSYDPFANSLGIAASNGVEVNFGFPARMSVIYSTGNVSATNGSVTAQYGLVSTFGY